MSTIVRQETMKTTCYLGRWRLRKTFKVSAIVGTPHDVLEIVFHTKAFHGQYDKTTAIHLSDTCIAYECEQYIVGLQVFTDRLVASPSNKKFIRGLLQDGEGDESDRFIIYFGSGDVFAYAETLKSSDNGSSSSTAEPGNFLLYGNDVLLHFEEPIISGSKRDLLAISIANASKYLPPTRNKVLYRASDKTLIK